MRCTSWHKEIHCGKTDQIKTLILSSMVIKWKQMHWILWRIKQLDLIRCRQRQKKKSMTFNWSRDLTTELVWHVYATPVSAALTACGVFLP